MTDQRPAPAASAFPEYPPSWYLFCEARELGGKPLSKQIVGRLLVAYRGVGGAATVMDGHCAHQSADLGQGQVIGDSIECPYHNWRYGADGKCNELPSGGEIPVFACLATYPVVERHGYVFFFTGPTPLFPLPFFQDEAPEDYSAGRLFEFDADCTWYMTTAHGFDLQHFAAVHDRRLLAKPTIDCPAPFVRRNVYHAEVVGNSVFDRLLHRFAGKTVTISISTWGGTFVVIEGRFERVHSRFVLMATPRQGGETLCQGIVFARRGGPLRSLMAPMQLWIRRLFTFGYLRHERELLRGTRYHPKQLIEDDREMINYFNWLADLFRDNAREVAVSSSEDCSSNQPHTVSQGKP